MLYRYALSIVLCGVVAAGGCRRSETDDSQSELDTLPLSKLKPEAERPRTIFPVAQRTNDATLNAFVAEAMAICSAGDYDDFRQLFGTAQPPPDKRRFARVWSAVREIRVEQVIEGRQDPKDYYAWVVVQYREPDRDNREQREVLIHVYKEQGEWRLGAPSQEARDLLLAQRVRDKAAASDRDGPPDEEGRSDGSEKAGG